MLINAQRPEELRVAIIEDGRLENYQTEVAQADLCRGNIYRGIVANVEPSLNAAFIEFGAERHGFITAHDIVEQAWHRTPSDKRYPRIDQILQRGKPIIVQVTKDAMGSKGASLTTSLSLAGRYLVLTPLDSSRGVSRKVEDEAREDLRAKVRELDLPPGIGCIIRTNGVDQSKLSLSRDLNMLLRLWQRIEEQMNQGGGARLLYNDQDLVLQTLRDYLDAGIDELIIDDARALAKASAYIEAVMPRSKLKVTHYTPRLPLFSRYNLEPQIDGIYSRTVRLPSGGSIVLDATEALTSIDVNSGKSTGARSQEETAYNTNLEAAREVARQLRLRDIGGLIVVDFIDMRSRKYQRDVERVLREAMKLDKARSRCERISENGLLEINRQRIKQALQLQTHRPCPTCAGVGRIASPEFIGLNLLRRIEARAAIGGVERVTISLHPELADSIQNSRRRELMELELEFGIAIEIVSSSKLHRSDEEIQWHLGHSRLRTYVPRAAHQEVLPAPGLDPEFAVAFGANDAEEEEQPEESRAAGPPPSPDSDADSGRGGRRRRRGGRRRRRSEEADVSGELVSSRLEASLQADLAADADDDDDDDAGDSGEAFASERRPRGSERTRRPEDDLDTPVARANNDDGRGRRGRRGRRRGRQDDDSSSDVAAASPRTTPPARADPRAGPRGTPCADPCSCARRSGSARGPDPRQPTLRARGPRAARLLAPPPRRALRCGRRRPQRGHHAPPRPPSAPPRRR